MKLEVEGTINTVGTSWDTVTDLKINYTNPQGEKSAFCVDCTKEQCQQEKQHELQIDSRRLPGGNADACG